VAVFVPGAGGVCGLDDPIERRRGQSRQAQGLDRDPVRSSPAHVVTVRGRRWLRCRLLSPRPGAPRVWALPLMTVLGPAARF
jgi:hypothetical protein